MVETRSHTPADSDLSRHNSAPGPQPSAGQDDGEKAQPGQHDQGNDNGHGKVVKGEHGTSP